jgi:alcohol dehydrogenase class IV
MLPRVLEYNRIYCMARLAAVAQAMGEKVDNLSVDDASKQAIEAVRRLIKDVNIPPLCDTKFRMEDVDILAENALKDTATATNTVRPTLDDIKTIIAKTYYEGLLLKKVNENG